MGLHGDSNLDSNRAIANRTQRMSDSRKGKYELAVTYFNIDSANFGGH